MTTSLPLPTQVDIDLDIDYPSSDGEPLAETSIHFDAIVNLVLALRFYLEIQAESPGAGIVLSNQFLYYAQGLPKLRVAPDVMVIFGVAPGGRDNYKIWEEGQVPVVIFEITSPKTQEQDQIVKKTLYEQLGVTEYWLFDPKGEWIAEKLRGYRLEREQYQRITDDHSQVLNLRLQVEEALIGLYRLDTGERLLMPLEQAQALKQEVEARLQAQQQVEELKAKLRALGVDPDSDAGTSDL